MLCSQLRKIEIEARSSDSRSWARLLGESVLSLGLAGVGSSLGDGWAACMHSSFPICFLVSLRIVLEGSSQGQRVVGMLGSVLGMASLGLHT